MGATEPNRANEFIRLYNELDAELRRHAGASREIPFSRVIDDAAMRLPSVKAHREVLKDYADLRNAIVHHRVYPDTVIAEPTAETLDRFRSVFERVLSPPKLIPTYQRSIQCFTEGDPLVAALTEMRNCDYSQVVIRRGDGALSLLTTEGVSRWLEERAKDDIISISDALIEDALPLDLPGSIQVLGRNDTIYHAREAFATSIVRGQPRLYAILVTNSGKRDENPIGIVTPWDLLNI